MTRLKAIDLAPRYGRKAGWWAVKCLDCGEWITKYDWTAEEAMELAELENHDCGGQQSLL